MAPITVWKKSKLAALSLMALFAVIDGELHRAAAITGKRPLPVLSNIGIIPIQWQGQDTSYPFQKLKKKVEKMWSLIPGEAKRFNLLNFEVSSELWSSPEGRKELVEQYETQGFVSLTAALKPDVVVFTTRILNPSLSDTYLHEVETVSRSWFNTAMEEEIHDRITDLLFRMLNRLPIDTNVMSVQGSYITINAGLDQNLKIGDELGMIRSYVVDTHPATGAWLSFDNKNLGTAKVVDVKQNSAIAQVEDLAFEGAVQVGDGARIDDLPCRIRFKRLVAKPDFETTHESDNPIVYAGEPKSVQTAGLGSPKIMGTQVVKQQQKQAPAQPAPPPPAKQEFVAKSKIGDPKGDEDDEKEEVPFAKAEESQEVTEPLDIPVKDNFTTAPHLYLKAAARSFNVRGPYDIDLNNKLPLWLFNSFSGMYGQLLDSSMGWDGIGHIEIGETKDGGYSGFGVGGRFYYRMLPWKTSTLLLGGQLVFNSIGVNDGGIYGGENMLKLSPFADYRDQISLSPISQNLEYFANLEFVPDLLPFGLGQVGMHQSMESVKKYSAYRLSIGANLLAPKEDIQWGGELSFGSENFDLGEGRVRVSDFSLAILASLPL